MKFIRTFLCIFGFGLSWVPVACAQNVSIRRVTDHVITLSMSNLYSTNVTVIETQKGLVVIETEVTPYIMNEIKEAAEKELGRKDWAYVINTHGHIHHAGGNCLFKGVPIIGHETMNMDWLKNRLSTKEGRIQYCNTVGTGSAIKQLRQNLSEENLTGEQKQELRHKLHFWRDVQKEIIAGFEVVNPTITFSDRYTLDLGDIQLRLIYWGDAIRHSSIFVHVVQDNMLVSSCMAEDWIPDFYGKASLKGIRNAISVHKELLDENFQIDVMIGVHSPELKSSKQPFRNQLKYMQTLLDELTKARQERLSLQQTKERLSLDKQFAFARSMFSKPHDLSKAHQKNIETFRVLLQEEALSDSQEKKTD